MYMHYICVRVWLPDELEVVTVTSYLGTCVQYSLYNVYHALLQVQLATMLPSSVESTVAFVLFILETYHIVSHLVILLRIRLLPRKDLVRVRYYFLIDAITVQSTALVFGGHLRWLTTIQLAQHMYYFIYWNQTGPAKKVGGNQACVKLKK
jgi:hypothetical protein